MSVWRWETAHLTNEDRRIELLFHFLLEDKAPGIGQHFAKTFSLHRFLKSHQGEPNLHRRVLRNGKPLFTAAKLSQIAKTTRHTQHGGAMSAGTGMYDKIFNRLSSLPASLSSLVTSLTSLTSLTSGQMQGLKPPCSGSLQQCFDDFPGLPGVAEVTAFFEKAIFLLHTLETDIPILGPALISPALDATTLGIPAAEGFVESGLHALAVVPGIGSFAVIAATVIGPILAIVATVLNLSRKQFGSAFQTSLAIIPTVGDALMEASQQLETFLKRLQERFDKVLVPLQEYSPTAAGAAQQYVPSLAVYTGPSTPLTMETVDKIKGEFYTTLQRKAAEDPRVASALKTVSAFWGTLVAAIPPEVMGKLNAGDVNGAIQEVMAIAQQPPSQILEKLGVPPELRALGEKAMKTAGNLRNAASALVLGKMPSVPSMPSTPSVPSMPSVPSAIKALKTRRRSRRFMRRNTRRRV